METLPTDTATLYRARRGRVDFVDVPDLSYLVIDGRGRPRDPEGPFQTAIGALFSVSYGARFIIRGRDGVTPRAMPLEALWWVEGEDPLAFATAPPEAWRWRALMVQPEPIDAATVELAVTRALTRSPHLEVPDLRRWREGLCAQTLHVGPYDAEGPTILQVQRAIADAGYRPTGHHHEIYLGDPRRCAPERLRTLLRQPVVREPGRG